MQWRSFLLLNTILVAYLLLGGLVFHLIEFNYDYSCNLTQKFDYILINYRSVIEDVNLTNTSGYEELMKELRAAALCKQTNAEEPQMSFSDGVYLAMTIMSAIGYGYFYPKTIPGKVVTVIYSFTAIPLFLLTSAMIAERMQGVTTKLLTNERFIKWKITSRKVRLAIKIVMLLLLSQLVFLIVPAVAVMYLEDWSYFDSYYFLVVTFVTVGFGDLNAAVVVDKPYVEVYRVMFYIWTLMGISFIALIIQTVVDALKTKTGQFEQKIAQLSKLVHDVAGPPMISGQYRLNREDSVFDTAVPMPVFKKKSSNAYFFGSTTVFGVNPSLHGTSRLSVVEHQLAMSTDVNDLPSLRSSAEDSSPLPTLTEEEEEDEGNDEYFPAPSVVFESNIIESRM